jgi:glycosyltransferase involved in cell wall biosynthesis
MAPDRSVKVAILTPHLPPRAGMGGIASAHFNLFAALAAAGWNVRAFAYLEAQDADTAAEVRRAPPAIALSAVRLLCRLLLRVLDPSHQSYQLAEALSGAIAGRRLRTPLALFDPDILVVPDKGCPLAFMDPPPGARVIWMSHHNPLRFLGTDFSPPLSALDAKLASMVEARGLARADLVLCPSRAMREQFHRTYLFRGPVEVAPHLLSGDVEAPGEATPPLRELLGIPASAPLFYLPAAATSVKGGKYLARLLQEIGRRHPQAGVFVSGTIENAWQSALAGAPAGLRIYGPGNLPYRENLARARECDVALSPALLESFGMALLEAAWQGVPVAAFAVEGIPELIGSGDGGANGETVPAGDLGRLCEAGDALLEKLRSGTLTREQVAEFTRERFSTARTLSTLGSLFLRTLEKAPQRAPV